MLQGELET